MATLEFSFLAGRYHATPWGRHVNEADLEWPPSPWRIARALAATWFHKANKAHYSRECLLGLLEKLSGTLPRFRLPTAVHTHTRHYMPQGGAKSSLVFDAFAIISVDDRLVVDWSGVSLAPDEQELLGHLAERIGYLGRAESWVEARLRPNGADGVTFNCVPGEGDIDPNTGEVLGERTQVMVPLSKAAYSRERERLASEYLVEKSRSATRIERTLPMSVIDALFLTSADYQAAGWSTPPAAAQVEYLRPVGCLRPTALPRRRPRNPRTVTTARFMLVGKPLPRVEKSVRVAEWFRSAVIAQGGRLFGSHNVPPELSGHGVPDRKHLHAFYLPEDSKGVGVIDRVIVHVPGGISPEGVTTLDALSELWQNPRFRFGTDYRLIAEGCTQAGGFGSPYCEMARKWVSVTPYLCPWHLKKGKDPEVQVFDFLIREARLRELPRIVAVEFLPFLVERGRTLRPTQFQRVRSKRGLVQPDRTGRFLRISFDEPVQGPIAFGFGNHFGLGLFRSYSGRANRRRGLSDG